MKSQLIAIVAAVLVVGCGPSVDIHQAVYDGNIEAVKQHLAAGSDVNAKDKLGRTPLHNAVGRSRKEITELLIAKGADVNASMENGKTPLHYAIGREEVAELLIAASADVNATDINGDTPLDRAIEYNLSETIALHRKHGGKTAEELKAEGK